MITFSKLGDPKWGRLGNQLFIIASTMGIAHRNGQMAVFPTWLYSQYFEDHLPEKILPKFQTYKHTSISYKPINLPAGDWDLEGFFTSEKYFDTIASTIRKQFAPAPHVVAYINQKYGLLLNRKPCSIHVRRGDYLKQSWDFPTQPIEYYRHAINQFPLGTFFIVFSDDIEWCKQQFMGTQFSFIEGELDIIDLFLMSRCQHHIVSNSTFSWWGAWLNSTQDKIVICPSRWFGPGVSSHPGQYTDDLYAKGFQTISLPNEKKWLINIYYTLAHPALHLWSVLMKVLHKFYTIF